MPNVLKCSCGRIMTVPDKVEMAGKNKIICNHCGSDLSLEWVYNLPVPVAAFSERRSEEFEFDEEI